MQFSLTANLDVEPKVELRGISVMDGSGSVISVEHVYDFYFKRRRALLSDTFFKSGIHICFNVSVFKLKDISTIIHEAGNRADIKAKVDVCLSSDKGE